MRTCGELPFGYVTRDKITESGLEDPPVEGIGYERLKSVVGILLHNPEQVSVSVETELDRTVYVPTCKSAFWHPRHSANSIYDSRSWELQTRLSLRATRFWLCCWSRTEVHVGPTKNDSHHATTRKDRCYQCNTQSHFQWKV